MIEPAKKIVHSAVVEGIKRTNNVTYVEMAKSIQVHPSYIQKVSKGLKTLSQAKFDQLCERWDVKIDDLIEQIRLEERDVLRRKTLIKIMNARKIDINTLPEQTGISFIDLSQIERGFREITDEELERIAAALGLDSLMLKEGRVAIALALIEIAMDSIYVHPSAKNAVLKYIEAEL